MKVVENSPQNAQKIALFEKNSWGCTPPNPPSNGRSFAARDMPLRGMYIQNLKNSRVEPPP